MESEPEAQRADAADGNKDGEGAVESKPVQDSIFSSENLAKDSAVPKEGDKDDSPKEPAMPADTVVLTSRDKVAFIDSMVNNDRFTKEYSVFGGRLTLTVRSLTTDEVNALSIWTVKSGANDTTGMMVGAYRKYLMAAQVARLDGVDMPPLEQPLFQTLDKDGKTVKEPGWVKRCEFWDSMPIGKFNAIIECLKDFDERYSLLCSKAEDANFWNPDTP